MQYGFLATHHKGMTCIVPALIAYNSCGLIGEQINDFAFAFIAPLCAKHNDIFAHICLVTYIKLLLRLHQHAAGLTLKIN